MKRDSRNYLGISWNNLHFSFHSCERTYFRNSTKCCLNR